MMKRHAVPAILVCLALALGGGAGLRAEPDEEALWRSLRYDVANMRVGPSRDYPIAWVYKRKGLPVRLLRERDEWIYVEDPGGTRGWISKSQVTSERGVIVTGDTPVAMLDAPQSSGALRWRAAPGVVARLLGCREGWCEIDVAGRVGWVAARRLWGVGEAET